MKDSDELLREFAETAKKAFAGSGKCKEQLGKYLIVAELQDRVFCFAIYTPGEFYKYVHATSESEYHFIGAIPLSLIEFHRDILAFMEQIVEDEELLCTGGGFCELDDPARLAYGRSTQFGPGDHEEAGKAFLRLLIHLKD